MLVVHLSLSCSIAPWRVMVDVADVGEVDVDVDVDVEGGVVVVAGGVVEVLCVG